ncbi:hypothetical protein EYR36_008615 [Pleurotus pulmonarius]|nr:hypothetical protein EYR36_008615 [Pleurotus pulmonarius]
MSEIENVCLAEIIMSRKRKRLRRAIDPCLGYYESPSVVTKPETNVPSLRAARTSKPLLPVTSHPPPALTWIPRKMQDEDQVPSREDTDLIPPIACIRDDGEASPPVSTVGTSSNRAMRRHGLRNRVVLSCEAPQAAGSDIERSSPNFTVDDILKKAVRRPKYNRIIPSSEDYTGAAPHETCKPRIYRKRRRPRHCEDKDDDSDDQHPPPPRIPRKMQDEGQLPSGEAGDLIPPIAYLRSDEAAIDTSPKRAVRRRGLLSSEDPQQVESDAIFTVDAFQKKAMKRRKYNRVILSSEDHIGVAPDETCKPERHRKRRRQRHHEDAVDSDYQPSSHETSPLVAPSRRKLSKVPFTKRLATAAIMSHVHPIDSLVTGSAANTQRRPLRFEPARSVSPPAPISTRTDTRLVLDYAPQTSERLANCLEPDTQ